MLFDRLIGKASPASALRRGLGLLEREQFTEALPLLAQAAQAGLPEAAYQIGRLYLQGSGVPYSQSEAVRWLQQAALHGNVEAECLLAALVVQWLVSAPETSADEGAARLFSTTATSVASPTPDFEAAHKWA